MTKEDFIKYKVGVGTKVKLKNNLEHCKYYGELQFDSRMMSDCISTINQFKGKKGWFTITEDEDQYYPWIYSPEMVETIIENREGINYAGTSTL
jgi:hypothetical protein